MALTRDEIAVALRAIERALADRLVIVRKVIAANGKVVATFRKSVALPKKARA